jgi:hypothetical protein
LPVASCDKQHCLGAEHAAASLLIGERNGDENDEQQQREVLPE